MPFDQGSPRTVSFEQLPKDRSPEILAQLDVTVLLELAIIFYLDDSLFLLILKLTVYVSFVAPRPASLTSNPQIAPVLLANFLCFVGHLFAAAPHSVEGGSYGYIHDAAIVDFVGELGPISKWRLICLDILVLALQLVMLGVTWEKEKLKGQKNREGEQDLEAEEAGLRNSQDGHAGEDGIQLRDLSARERDRPTMGSHHSDKFYTSEHVAIELNIVASLRGLASSTTPASSTTADHGGVIGSILARMAHRP